MKETEETVGFTLRMPKSLYEWVVAEAEAGDIKKNTLMVAILKQVKDDPKFVLKIKK